jgi:hypothetical protein
VIPHDYKRALADDLEPRGDNPTSSGGDGFLTTETEEAA